METLLAVGTLAIGLVFVAGTFLAGVYLATISTEGTIATVVADEAFAKIRLYAVDPNLAALPTDGYVSCDQLLTIPDEERDYPSTVATNKQYYWTALCKHVDADSRLVDVMVFVCRRATKDAPDPVQITLAEAPPGSLDTDVSVVGTVAETGADAWLQVGDGAMLVDNSTGEVYRVLERYTSPQEQIRLDRPWTGIALGNASAWIVPRPQTGTRNPLVAVYQKVLRF